MALTSQSSGWAVPAKASPEDATGASREVAYVYGISGGRLLDNGNMTKFSGSDMVNFTVSTSPQRDSASYETGRSMESIKGEISRKINRGNDLVRDHGMDLIGKISGPRQIDQICAIYEFLVDERNWTYVSDWSGLDQFQYSNYTLRKGLDVGGLGKGDCDDFAILLGALVESVGASSRIVFAYGPTGGHAYTEVYLGKAQGPGSDADQMIRWLQHEYNVEDINVHTNLSTGDVWLNLDWWKEPGGAKHPGGPFFMASKHVQVYPDISEPLEPLTPLNEPPIVQFNMSNIRPNAGETVTFDASASRDLGGPVESYEWNFGDGEKSQGLQPRVDHVYSIGGSYNVTLKARDDMGAGNSSIQEIWVNNLPVANFTISPRNPVAGDLVTFDATLSSDAEDGQELLYYWEFDNNSATDVRKTPGRHEYPKSGYLWINLTVTDSNGAKDTKSIFLKINEPPLAHFTYEKDDYNIGDEITFKADCRDADGSIVSYAWDFGDSSTPVKNQTTKHTYREAGMKNVKLIVMDNDNATSSYSKDIYLNFPPKALFSYEPMEPEPGQRIVFNASISEDPDKGELRYFWDFGEGREPEAWKIQNAKHVYEESGKYEVTLKVEDDKGATSANTSIIEVWPKILLVTASEDKTARIWDAASGQEVHKLTHDGWVYGASFSPDRTTVVTWSVDNTARIWDVSSGQEIHRLTHNGPMRAAAFNPDSTKLVTCSIDGTARIWDVSSGQEIHRLTPNQIRAATFSPDGTKVLTGGNDSTARIWDVSNGQEIHRLTHNGGLSAVTFSPDGTKVATGSIDKTARIWDVASGQELNKLPHKGIVRSVAFSPDGNTVATASEDKTARIWDAQSGQELHELPHEGNVTSVAFSPDGNTVATASEDKTARVWDVASGREVHKLNHEGYVYSVAFSPDGKKVATASEDKTARIWDVASGQELHKLTHDGKVWDVSFSPA